MTMLYVANTTQQFHEFTYRVPGESSQKMMNQRIPPGTQQRIFGDAPLPVIKGIIDQHRNYGLISAAEAVKKSKNFIGLCYSIDSPVSFDELNAAVEHNKKVKQAEDEQRKLETAIAFNSTMEEALDRPMSVSEVEVVEEGDNPKIAVGVEVARSEDTARRSRLRRRQG